MFTSAHKRQFLHHRNDIATAAAVIAAAAEEIRLSYVIINITIIEINTKAA